MTATGRQEAADRRGGSESPAGDGVGAGSSPVEVRGRDELASVVEGADVALVDFYAEWCTPCRAVEPALERVAAETDAAVAAVDVDANQPIAAEFGVRGLPTLVVFAGGEPVDRYVGVQRPSALLAAVERPR